MTFTIKRSFNADRFACMKKRSFVADVPGIFGGWVRSLDKRFLGWREDVHIHSSFVHRSSFVVFTVCSRSVPVSKPFQLRFIPLLPLIGIGEGRGMFWRGNRRVA